MLAPRMTYYARVLDNVTKKQVVPFTSIKNNNLWYFGKCNGTLGGESQYIIELDIWNNEPAFNAGTYDVHVADATNCKLTVISDQNASALFDLDEPFMYARNITLNNNEDFKGIKDYDIMLDKIGRHDNSIIKGNGDNALIQTKIKIPSNSQLKSKRHNFALTFYYDFE